MPPPQVWQAVEEGLMPEEYNRLAQKLEALAPAPPQSIWENIEASLDDATPLVQLTPRRVWMRYAAGIAAAAVITYFIVRPAYTTQALPDTVQQSTVIPSIILPKNEPLPQRQTVAVMARTKSYKEVNPPVLPQVSGSALPVVQPALNTNNGLPEVVAIETPLVNDQQLERYIVLETGEAAVKLPKKIYNFFRCDEVPDKIACAFRLNHLRMQAASPSLLATSDFSGVLEMVQHVK